jgi:hypothetical protein
MAHPTESDSRKDTERATPPGPQLEQDPYKDGENHTRPTTGPTTVDKEVVAPIAVDGKAVDPLEWVVDDPRYLELRNIRTSTLQIHATCGTRLATFKLCGTNLG